MLQMPSGWKGAEGAGYVSSEDESWLDHPGFHLSDSEGDEARSVGLQYVQAVVAVKVERRYSPGLACVNTAAVGMLTTVMFFRELACLLRA